MMMTLPFRTHFNVVFDPSDGWTSSLPSETVPTEGKTLRELQDKYSRVGLSSQMSDYKTPLYDDPNAPFDAPLTPDRLNLSDPVDVDSALSDIDSYVSDVNEHATSLINASRNKSSVPNVSSKLPNDNVTTTINDDDTN